MKEKKTVHDEHHLLASLYILSLCLFLYLSVVFPSSARSPISIFTLRDLIRLGPPCKKLSYRCCALNNSPSSGICVSLLSIPSIRSLKMIILGSEGKGNPTWVKRSLVVMSGNEQKKKIRTSSIKGCTKNMITVKGNNKRGSSAAFYTQLVDDEVVSKLSSTLTPSSISTSGTISGGQLNASALTLGTTTVNWGSNVAHLQTYARLNDSFMIACIPYNSPKSLFSVQTNGFVQCCGVQLNQIPGATSSGLYMYGTNVNGSNTPVRCDASLVCSGGTLNGTNTGVLAINAATTAVNGNLVINVPDVMSSGLYMNGTNGSNTTLHNDVSLVCSGGTLNSTNTGNLAINAATTTVNGNLVVTGTNTDNAGISATALTLTGTTGSNITLPSTYPSGPVAGSLGYLYSLTRTSTLAVNANTSTAIHSFTIPQGVWMLYGTAIYQVNGNVNWFQLGISTTTAFDDYTSVLQHVVTTTSGTGMITPAPQRYYCSNVTSTTIYLVLYLNGCSATVQGTAGPTYTTLRALRIA